MMPAFESFVARVLRLPASYEVNRHRQGDSRSDATWLYYRVITD